MVKPLAGRHSLRLRKLHPPTRCKQSMFYQSTLLSQSWRSGCTTRCLSSGLDDNDTFWTCWNARLRKTSHYEPLRSTTVIVNAQPPYTPCHRCQYGEQTEKPGDHQPIATNSALMSCAMRRYFWHHLNWNRATNLSLSTPSPSCTST
jgi:hypothetical protein